MPFGLKIRSYFWAKSLGNVMKFAVHGLCFLFNSDLKSKKDALKLDRKIKKIFSFQVQV